MKAQAGQHRQARGAGTGWAANAHGSGDHLEAAATTAADHAGVASFCLAVWAVDCHWFRDRRRRGRHADRIGELGRGEVRRRLLMNPPPRSSKTVCAVLALAYSIMRYPLRGHILLPANARLARESNSMLRTIVEAALPAG